MPEGEQESPRLLSASLSSASYLVLLQLFSRICTFILNQILVRLASPQTFGTASIQFELLLSTILFLSREGVRNAVLRSAPGKASQGQLVTNISLLPVVFGIPASCIFSIIYITTSPAATRSQPYFVPSVATYAVAAAIELASEPLYIRAQNDFRFDVRVRAEGIAVFTKSTVTFLVLALGRPEWALLAFAAGQAGYGLATLGIFLIAYGVREHYNFQKVIITNKENKQTTTFDPELLRLARAMTVQSFVKHFLTEGDKFLVSWLSPLEDQGGYAIASNYGSLVARIVFQPIEETSRVFFSKAFALAKDGGEDAHNALQTAGSLLMTLLLASMHLFLLLATFAPPYLPLAMSIFLPQRYLATSAPKILGAYIYYIPIMAFNGILEAFFASACTPADLRKQSTMMAAATAGFVATSVMFSRGLDMGDVGLIWANICNLGARALYAWTFARGYFTKSGFPRAVVPSLAMPPAHVLSVFAVAASVTRWSAHRNADAPLSIMAQKAHLSTGVVCVFACIAACFIFQRARLAEMTRALRSR
ncbi:Rft-1-domain-containing protein [Vararia minispora EC-137]|uniref:Rft-1-domain-containing protein n=1 Tax=Vararia minispora EC-137 TaxID=1314806 RepID=A0ACB8QTG7_9AGAM|nr:Rft-1-domain-containing protein [Vararia minispora EC-137]